MPLITLTIRKGHPADFKRKVLDSVHGALVANGVPIDDNWENWSFGGGRFIHT